MDYEKSDLPANLDQGDVEEEEIMMMIMVVVMVIVIVMYEVWITKIADVF